MAVCSRGRWNLVVWQLSSQRSQPSTSSLHPNNDVIGSIISSAMAAAIGTDEARSVRGSLRIGKRPANLTETVGTPVELLSVVSILLKRSLTGKRHHVVLRAGAAAHPNCTDHLAVDDQRIAAT